MKKLCVLLPFLFLLSSPALAAPELPEQRIGLASNFTCFIVTPDGHLITWGSDNGNCIVFDDRRVIFEDAAAFSGAYLHAFVLTSDGVLYGWGSDD